MAHGVRDFIYSVILYTAMGLFLRKFVAPEGRRVQLSLNRDGSLVFLYAPRMSQWGKGGSRRLRKTG
jgi:hypothetical protein